MKFKKNFMFFLLCLLYLNLFNVNKIFALKDKIIVGLDINVPPMGFLGKNNEIVGFDIDLAKEVFGEKVFFQSIDWDAKELELETGKIDVIWNGLSKTDEREKHMLLTRPYMKNHQIAIVNKKSEINELEDLENKTICVQKGSTGVESLKSHYINKKIKEIIELENMVNCLNEVETYKSDATVVDEIVAKFYLNKKGLSEKFKILNQEISTEDYVIAVKKGNFELMDEIENRLSNLNYSEKTKEISEKWFGSNMFFWEEPQKNLNKNTQENKKINFLPIFIGFFTTLKLFFIVIIFSLPLGLLICILQNSKNKFFNITIRLYTNLIRGTPLLLQLFFIFYGLPYIPALGEYLTFRDRFLAGVFTFILNYSAYFVDIFRSGFLGINKGQYEAAKVLGFSKSQTLFKILLPQVIRIALPTICNECISLVKDTALIFAIGVQELLSNAKNIVNSTADVTSYVIAAGIYLLTCALIAQVFKILESKFYFGRRKFT
ncbi:MAG: polar amino acid transport system substrate-binding protein [Candidatus Paraimprobicoccus trichonymphae]|uniref:Polar amino acid transport system substrate-binding protein n=1 Tax=Candidatus Paraimprobicoccus trichonymphae TaxID=3033793 RepID=A0AA48IHJ2_9FIRM|nr:MAG: polar amino acid transport system substrate-binding protein [Candidatus Paraimprobicoccus trichonymphae]